MTTGMLGAILLIDLANTSKPPDLSFMGTLSAATERQNLWCYRGCSPLISYTPEYSNTTQTIQTIIWNQSWKTLQYLAMPHNTWQYRTVPYLTIPYLTSHSQIESKYIHDATSKKPFDWVLSSGHHWGPKSSWWSCLLRANAICLKRFGRNEPQRTLRIQLEREKIGTVASGPYISDIT